MPLVAPALLATSPLYVLVFAWAFRRLPGDLYDACRLAGMSPFAIWWRMAMPLVRPVTVGVGVLAFVISWGNFLDPLIYLYDPDLYTLPLGLRALAELDRTDYPRPARGCGCCHCARRGGVPRGTALVPHRVQGGRIGSAR